MKKNNGKKKQVVIIVVSSLFIISACWFLTSYLFQTDQLKVDPVGMSREDLVNVSTSNLTYCGYSQVETGGYTYVEEVVSYCNYTYTNSLRFSDYCLNESQYLDKCGTEAYCFVENWSGDRYSTSIFRNYYLTYNSSYAEKKNVRKPIYKNVSVYAGVCK